MSGCSPSSPLAAAARRTGFTLEAIRVCSSVWGASRGRDENAVEAEGAEFVAQPAVGIEVGGVEGLDEVEKQRVNLAVALTRIDGHL